MLGGCAWWPNGLVKAGDKSQSKREVAGQRTGRGRRDEIGARRTKDSEENGVGAQKKKKATLHRGEANV